MAAGHQLVGFGIVLPLLAAATSAALVAGAPGEFPRVAQAALVLVILIGVAQPVRSAAVTLAGLAALGQAVAVLIGGEASPLQALVGVTGLLGVGVAADALGTACRRARAERAEIERVVEALRPVDAVAGVTKWSHARLAFDRELASARRYSQPLTLLHVAVDQWEVVRARLDPAAVAAVLAEVGDHLVRSCRDVDIAAYLGDGVFLILLTNTPSIGSHVVARRVGQLRPQQVGVRLRAGVASLTDEPTTIDDLLGQAELAATIGGQIGRTLATHSGPATLSSVGVSA